MESIRELLHMFHEELLEDIGFGMIDALYDKLVKTDLVRTTWVAVDVEKGVVGLFTGFMTEYLLDGSKIFHEMVWYIKPEYREEGQGNKFYDYVEGEVKKLGAEKIVMIHLEIDRSVNFGPYLIQKGYKPLEKHYIKDLELVCQT